MMASTSDTPASSSCPVASAISPIINPTVQVAAATEPGTLKARSSESLATADPCANVSAPL